MSSDLVKRLRETKEDWPANLVYLEQEAADRIEALEGEVARLNAECCRCGQPTTAVCKAARDTDARAERLRVVLTKAHNDLDISPLTDKEREAVVDAISAAIDEDDKQ